MGRGPGRERSNKDVPPLPGPSPALSSCGEERENIGSGQALVVSRCARDTHADNFEL